ncbi:hypothetical protein NQ314_015051 [Rhamnusium bicolor]|uniref:SWIM-type domain-containing protein n=1 Tax=Rhamnusium bicolor TaxID=1586634 RepID=A0AAV8WZF0_9CUCU|nr:hypothetical protein NQ314_015051 [Rhamnusium bicolor]
MLRKSKDVLVHNIDSSSTDKHLFYTTYLGISFCDCISGQGGRFCKHLCAVQQEVGVVLRSAPCLTLDDKKDFAKIARGENISTFFDSMDTNDDLYENIEHVVSDTIEFSKSNIPVSKMANLPETENILEDEEHSLAVSEMSQAFR